MTRQESAGQVNQINNELKLNQIIYIMKIKFVNFYKFSSKTKSLINSCNINLLHTQARIQKHKSSSM